MSNNVEHAQPTPLRANPAVTAPPESRAQPSAGGAADPWARPALRYGFLVLVAATTFVIDQLSKLAIKTYMVPGQDIPIVAPVLDLHYITNRGVAFGLFSRFGDVFVPVALIIMAVIFGYYRSLRQRQLWLRLALGLQLGGALGNLLDRLRYGSVVDFLDFHIDAINFHWPVFNLADSSIVVGVCILVVCLALQPER